MKKVLWLSRHPLGDDQLEDLKKSFKEDIAVEMRNVLWKASANAEDDIRENAETWRTLVSESEGPHVVICGVFPPVALEALRTSSEPDDNLPIAEQILVSLWSPVSEQKRELREDGEAQIKFVHLRWAHLVCEWFRG